jgi:hypothetical protein
MLIFNRKKQDIARVEFFSDGPGSLTGEGPIVRPVTDTSGHKLRFKPDLIELKKPGAEANGMRIDRRKPLRNPIEIYDHLPPCVQRAFRQEL